MVNHYPPPAANSRDADPHENEPHENELLQSAHQLWGEARYRMLVTGGTGFIGWRLAEILAQVGHQVTILGRNRYRVPWSRHGIEFAAADLGDDQAVWRAIDGQDFVFHAAALSRPWGPRQQFQRANVDGTRIVADACLANSVRRLVHISTSAVFFEHRDRLDVDDNSPVTAHPSCHYAATKIAAEEVVRQSMARGLNAFTIRARAVFGPRDPSLLPRIFEAAEAGRLRVIGRGENVVDLTYVDNLVHALMLAALRGPAGGVATITNHEPVQLWPTIEEVLRDCGHQTPLKSAPAAVVKLAARLSEWGFAAKQTLASRGNPDAEPKLTRYAVGLLTHSQTFSPRASRELLDYRPIVPFREGLRRTITALQSPSPKELPMPTNEPLNLRLMTTGYTPQPARLIEHGQRGKTWKIQATFAIIEHPKEGLTLFDTGYSSRFFEATRRLPYRLYRYLTPVEMQPSWNAVEVLRRSGIEPLDVRRIIVSHFHGDHIGGLRDFPSADFVASRTAWENVQGRRGLAAMKRGFLPTLLPDDFAARLHLIDDFHDPGFEALGRSHDLFGDGSLKLFSLPGHAVGQMGALVTTAEATKFLVADATWTRRTLSEELPFTLPFRLLAESKRDLEATRRRLVNFHQQHPEIELIPTHCPQVAEQYTLTEQPS